MGNAAAASGPDFEKGVPLADIPPSGTLAGRVKDEPVLLSRIDGRLYAVSGACTHYGAALAAGLVSGETIRCPLHHACFSLRTGAALRAPAMAPLESWIVEAQQSRVFVRTRKGIVPTATVAAKSEPRSILIVGGGAAAFGCAHALRSMGYRGRLTMVSDDDALPCDRPNLSKDYLAGTAPEAWLPLRDEAWYADQGIELRLGTGIVEIDATRRVAVSGTGESFAYDRLLLATGAEPVRLGAPGFDRANVHMLRSLADARHIIERARRGTRACVIGSSFIGLEAAAALRGRGVDVIVVSTGTVPFERIFGADVGRFFQVLHERNGVTFHFGRSAAAFDAGMLTLDNGERIPADFVVVGIGVEPRVALADAAGIAIDDGVLVDPWLETSRAGIYAAGDIASYPDARSGRRLRIEHWVTALEQGRTAAANMLGVRERFARVPFFWSEQYGTAIRYVGHAGGWDDVRVEGDIGKGDFTARYYEQGRLVASASVGRDADNLEDELLLESQAAPSVGPSVPSATSETISGLGAPPLAVPVGGRARTEAGV